MPASRSRSSSPGAAEDDAPLTAEEALEIWERGIHSYEREVQVQQNLQRLNSIDDDGANPLQHGARRGESVEHSLPHHGQHTRQLPNQDTRTIREGYASLSSHYSDNNAATLASQALELDRLFQSHMGIQQRRGPPQRTRSQPEASYLAYEGYAARGGDHYSHPPSDPLSYTMALRRQVREYHRLSQAHHSNRQRSASEAQALDLETASAPPVEYVSYPTVAAPSPANDAAQSLGMHGVENFARRTVSRDEHHKSDRRSFALDAQIAEYRRLQRAHNQVRGRVEEEETDSEDAKQSSAHDLGSDDNKEEHAKPPARSHASEEDRKPPARRYGSEEEAKPPARNYDNEDDAKPPAR